MPRWRWNSVALSGRLLRVSWPNLLGAGSVERKIDGQAALVEAGRGAVQIAAIDVERIDPHQDFASAGLALAKRRRRLGRQVQVRAGLHPAADQLAADVHVAPGRLGGGLDDVA